MKIFTPQNPFELSDFSRGRYAPTAIDPIEASKDTVQDAMNVNFDTLIGAAKVRLGTTKLGATVAGNRTPLGLSNFTAVQIGKTYEQNPSSPNMGGSRSVFGNNWFAQTFTPTTSHICVGVRVRLYTTGTPLNALTVSIYNTSGGLPTTSINGNNLAVAGVTQTAPGLFYDINFASLNIALTANTKYAIVLKTTAGDGSNCWNIEFDANHLYQNIATSTDGGSTWAADASESFLFQEYGPGFTPQTEVLAVYSGASNATIYYYDTSWKASQKTNLDNTNKMRFAELNGTIYGGNGVDKMQWSSDGIVWNDDTYLSGQGFRPSLLHQTRNRLLAAGSFYAASNMSRIFFSAIPDATSPGTQVSFSANASTGDFIDVNPDDGGYLTGFDETSTGTLVYKNNGIYRLDAISKTIVPVSLFPIGAVSQEAITNCQGISYFFSGTGIWQTAGDIPQQIDRLGVSDYIAAIPQSNWNNVALGNDDFNVYVSIGNITLNTNLNNQVSYNNVVLKFSIRDQSWSTHYYANQYRFFEEIITSAGKTLIGSDADGNVQTLNSGTTDNGTAINFFLTTQDLEFGSRAHWKEIANTMGVYTQFGIDSQIQCSTNGQDFHPVGIELSQRVNKSSSIQLAGYFFNFKWMGVASANSPILEGFYLDNINDRGLSGEQ